MSEPTESTVQVTGELTEFPGFLKLPGEVQSLVVAGRSIEEIFRLTISSHVGCQIIRNAKLKACLVEIDQENHEIRVQIMNRKWIIWRFRKSSRVLTTMSLRDMMLAARETGGEWCTLCTDPRTAMREAFDHMKHLFGIHEIRKARLRITDARQYYHGFKILERIRRLRYLDLHTELPIEEEKLKAVLDLGPFVYLKISYPEHIAFQYSKPLPYATRLSINNSVTNWFSKQHFRNLQCSYLCWTDNSSSAGIIMNTIFRRWKAGGFPEMRIIECEELARVPDIGEVVGGLGAEKVGERRVQIFNRALPFIAKQLITFKTQQLDISGAVDFTRTTDGTIATVIPLRGCRNYCRFLFFVWGSWVKW